MHPAVARLAAFVKANVLSGNCQCSECVSLPLQLSHPEHPKRMPGGLWFGLRPAVNPCDFVRLTADAIQSGGFERDGLKYDLFDGHPYNYEDLEGFFDSRMTTLQFMALGLLLNLFTRIAKDHVMFLLGGPAEDGVGEVVENELATAT